jgi:hypothetical protein
MSVIKVNKMESTGTTAGGVEVDSSGHVTVDGVQMPTAGALSSRNLVINGGMTVWQRGTASAAVTNAFLADRFVTIEATDGAITHEQSTDAPDGFAYSLKLSVTTADTSLAAGQYAQLDHRIEAQNCQHLKYGSSAAETITLSFWVKSSKTGTYCIRLGKIDSTGYAYVKEYTISSANTWEKKTITIEPDNSIKASAGAIANDNGEGLRITWPLAMGSTYSAATDGVWSSNLNDHATANAVNWLDGTSNNLYLTGVQLEVGEKATPFEHRSYGDELASCMRYFHTANWQYCWLLNGVTYRAIAPGPSIPMRTTPDVSYFHPSTGTANQARQHSSGTAHTINDVGNASDAYGPSTYFGMSSTPTYPVTVKTQYDAEL